MKKAPLALLILLAVLFVLGLTQLFRLRFEAGDVYPEYSSLRADPLGAKAFYESLENLLAAQRNYRPLSKLGDGRDSTLFYLGARASFMSITRSDLRLLPEEFKDLESFVADGGRLVISFFPTFEKPRTNSFGTTTRPPTSGAPRNRNTGPTAPPKNGPFPAEEELADFRRISIQDRWGLDYGYEDLLKDDNNVYKPAVALKSAPTGGLPERLSCHTALYFDNLTNSWRVIYARKKALPVIIERNFGSGTIVLCADSYLFSNEALWKERSPELLAWMVGPMGRVLFDETHLGVEEAPGVMALGRKYRLHGLFAGLLLLAGLFVWKNSTSFVPPYEDERESSAPLVLGKDSAAGFVNLLRRNIPAREILPVCLTEWKKSCSREQSKARLQKMQAIIDAENDKEPGERNPVETYRAIAGVLSKHSAAHVRQSKI